MPENLKTFHIVVIVVNNKELKMLGGAEHIVQLSPYYHDFESIALLIGESGVGKH